MIHTYESGLPFNKKLAENLDDLKLRVKRNKASLLIIDGGVGEGKTTLAIHCADHIQGNPIDFNESLGMGGKDFLHKLRLSFQKGYLVIIYDEAGDFNRRGSLTRFNAMMNRTFETFRAFKIVVILVLPNFAVLDSDLFDKGIPRLLLHCEGRSEEYGNFRGYSLSRMLYIKERMKKSIVRATAYQAEAPNLFGQFLDLPPERSRQLDAFSTKGKMRELQGAEIKIEGLVSYQEIAQKLVRSVINIKQLIAKNKIKPARIINRRAYFDQGVTDVLAEVIDDINERRYAKKRPVQN